MHPVRLLGCRCPSGGRLFLFLTRRARRAADALRDGPGVPSRDARPPAPRPAFRRAWLWKTSCSIFYPLVTPRPQTCGCASTRISLAPRRALLQPGGRTHTERCGGPPPPTSRRVRAPFSPAPRSQPLPRELHTPQSAPGCVAHTHTQWVARARGRGDEAASTAATARVRHALFSLATPPRHAHTHTQPRSCTWPTLRRTPTHPSCCTFCQRPATAAPARTPAPVPFLWDPRAARSFAFAHARVRGGTGTRTAAVQQELHTERQPAPAAVHRKNPTRRFPQTPCATPRSHDPFCRTALGRRSVHSQRAAPCTPHRSYKTSRDTRTAPAPPRPPVQNARAAPTRELTPNLHTGRFRGHRDPGAEVERRREVRAPLSYARSIASPGASCHPQRAEPLHCTPLAHFVAHSRDASCTNFLSYSSAPGPCLRRYRPHSGPCSRSGLCTCQRGRYMGLTMVPVAGLQRLHLHRRSRPSSSAAQPPH